MPPQDAAAVQDQPLGTMPLWCIGCFEPWALGEQQTQGELSLDSPPLPEDGSPERNSVVIGALPGTFMSQGRQTDHRGGD